MSSLGIPFHVCISVSSREMAMENGLLTAVQVPLCVARVVSSLWPTLKELSTVGNINCKSDLQVMSQVLILVHKIVPYNVTYSCFTVFYVWLIPECMEGIQLSCRVPDM